MSRLFLVAVALTLLAVCGGSSDGPTADFRLSPEVPVHNAIPIPPDLLSGLVEENAEHYTFACVYSYDFTEDGWTQADVTQGLPVPAVDGWAVGTLGIDADGSGDLTYVTLYDSEGKPTNAIEFERIDEAERACFLPKP